MSGLVLDCRIALTYLFQHRRRTSFLGGAIVLVSCAFVLLNALQHGVINAALETGTSLSTGHLNIVGYFKVTAGQVAPLLADYPKLKELVAKELPELDFAVARGRGFAKIVSDQGSIESPLHGVEIAHEPQLRRALTVESGNLDELTRPNTVLIFAGHAKKLGVKVGDAVTVAAQTMRGAANTVDCRVVAIARDVGLLSQWSVFVPSEVVRTLYQSNPETTGVLQLHVKAPYLGELPALAVRLRGILARAGQRVMPHDDRPPWVKFQAIGREDWIGQKLDVTTWQEELVVLMWTVSALRGLSALLTAILAAIVVLGLMSTLWIAIRERTREIGTLRAIGMQRAGVVRLFLLEAGFLGLGGAIAGVALGALLIAPINLAEIPVPFSVQLFLVRNTLVMVLDPETALEAIAAISLVTAGAALYPALRAARLEPVDAMAHFG